MANDIAPGFLKVFYNSNGNPHELTLPVDFDPTTPTPGSDPVLSTKGGGTVDASAAVAAYLALAKVFMPSTATFTGWEAYRKNVGEDPLFLFGDDISIAGTAAGAVIPNSQIVVSFRTGAGGVMKLYLMETAQTVNVRTAARTTAAAPLGAFVTFVLGSSNFIIGRDGGFPIFGLWYTTKTNDALRKRTLLDA